MKNILRFANIIYLYDYFRIDIIRYTMHYELPVWALELIWGWQ